MMVRVEVDGLKGHWDVEIPEDHEFIAWANKKRDESGCEGWAAVAAFEGGIRDCISDDMTVNIIPNDQVNFCERSEAE